MSSITYIKIGDATCVLQKLAVLQSEIFFSNKKKKKKSYYFFSKNLYECVQNLKTFQTLLKVFFSDKYFTSWFFALS